MPVNRVILPGLRSVHSTVRVPVLLCVVVVVLLTMINLQIHTLQNNVSVGVPPQGHTYDKAEMIWPDPVARRPAADQPVARPGADQPVERSAADQPVERSAADQPVERPAADQPVAIPRADQPVAPLADVAEVLLPQSVQREHYSKKNIGEDMLPQSVQREERKATPEETFSDGEIAALAQVLEMRLAQVDPGFVGNRNCSLLAEMKNVRGTCIDTTCPRQFHSSAETRIRQLLVPRLRPTVEQMDTISAIAKDVERKKYIFVTAASSNHYNESQALVYSMRKFIFSKLHPDTYSFYYFDLGLKPVERRRVVKNCNCTVKSMPFAAFPKHTRKLMCYAWKPFIIKALLQKTEVLVYMDVSIRFRPDMDLDKFFATARHRGAQFLSNGGDTIPNHTVESMFTFYGDLPCMYWPFPELLAGFSVFHNEPFMNKVVLDPWVSCALNESCMCPVDPHAFRICPHLDRRVGQCHRFDLSSLTLQLAKLYGDKVGQLVMQTNDRPRVARDDRMGYFTD